MYVLLVHGPCTCMHTHMGTWPCMYLTHVMMMGAMYAEGQAVERDDGQAVRLWLSAAEQGHASAQFNLGVMYATGRGVPQDDAEVVRWFGLSAAQSNAQAQLNLGVLYATGRGVSQNDIEAYKWFSLAVERSAGEERVGGETYRDAVAARMTTDDLAEARRRAAAWESGILLPSPGAR